MAKPEFIYETYIRASAEKIWAALTTPEFTRQYFFATDVESSWSVGSDVVYNYANGQPALKGQVLEIDPPRRLVFTFGVTWDEDLAREKASRVSIDIETSGEVCRLRLVHDEFAAHSKVLAEITHGWPVILASLKTLLETGEALPIAGHEKVAA